MRKYFLILVVWILIGVYCHEFERNPALEVFLSDSLSYHPLNYYSPVWAPSGDKIYCIGMKVKEMGTVVRMLICINLPNKKRSVIVKDSVMHFTLSHNGNEIAYVKGATGREYVGEHTTPLIEEKIVFINLVTGERKEFSPTLPYIEDLKYTHDDKFLIFLAKGDTSISGFYSLNLSTWEDSLILKIPIKKETPLSFTLHPQNDRIIMDASEDMWYPQFHPNNLTLLCTVRDANARDQKNSPDQLDEDEEIFLLDLSTGEKKPLNAKPYWATDIGRLSFSPDGSKIIFSAARPENFERIPLFICQELWILNLE